MLAFVTSVRHPLNSTDYRRVEQLLHASVASWARQTHPGFAIVVVANRDPELDPRYRAHVVEVDFAAPDPLAGTRIPAAALRRDKGSKLAVGVIRARELGATHIMAVDADDFVSRRLAGFVDEHRDAPGWAIADGWRINVERATIRAERGNFMRVCGSSHIVRADLYPAPQLPVDATQQQLVDGFGDRLDRWLGSHMYIDLDLGLPSLPFPGALYRVGTGESHSGNALGGLGRPITRSIAEEFGVCATPRTPVAQMRAVLPSTRAVTERLRRLGR